MQGLELQGEGVVDKKLVEGSAAWDCVKLVYNHRLIWRLMQEVELRDHVAARERLAQEAAAWDCVKYNSDVFKHDGDSIAERRDRKQP